jgi:alcohol dehydrogenase (cytochrome c)
MTKTSKLVRLGALMGLIAAASFSSSINAQTASELKADAGNGGDVLTYGMGYNAQRYSPGKQITPANIKGLTPIWNTSMGSLANASTQPLVYNGMMYVAVHDATMAVDALTGKVKWKVPVELPADINGFLCCGIHSRGLAIQDGVIFRTTLDAHVMVSP